MPKIIEDIFFLIFCIASIIHMICLYFEYKNKNKNKNK